VEFEVIPPGEVDATNANAFQGTLTSAPPGCDVVVLGNHVKFFDSAALRALLVGREHIEAGGGSLKVRHPSPQLAQLLALTGFDHLVDGDD
jgi:anti-anti-sigma factor